MAVAGCRGAEPHVDGVEEYGGFLQQEDPGRGRRGAPPARLGSPRVGRGAGHPLARQPAGVAVGHGHERAGFRGAGSSSTAAARAARARRKNIDVRMNWTRSRSERRSAGHDRRIRSQAASPSPQ